MNLAAVTVSDSDDFVQTPYELHRIPTSVVDVMGAKAKSEVLFCFLFYPILL